MRPTRKASPLCVFSPQWPETWLCEYSGPFRRTFSKIRLDMRCMLHNYVHECLILTCTLQDTYNVSGVVTLIFFHIVHQACWTTHFICNLLGACDVAITSIKISVIAIRFSMTKISNITCIRKYQFIKRMKMYSQTPLTPRKVRGPQKVSVLTGCPF